MARHCEARALDVACEAFADCDDMKEEAHEVHGEEVMADRMRQENDEEDFKRGVRFALVVMTMIGVDLGPRKLKAFLTELIGGDVSILPSPGEIEYGKSGVEMTPDEVKRMRDIVTGHRQELDALHREQATMMLEVVKDLPK